MQKPLNTTLPADLPEDWELEQIVSPTGTDVGLSEQHGYNYQSKQINDAQRAINDINNAFANVQEDLADLPDSSGISDADSIPVVTNFVGTKRKVTWLLIKNVLKAVFNTIFAPIIHNHGNITNSGAIGSVSGRAVITGDDGVLIAGTTPVAAGGTGASTAAGARTNLGVAAEVHNHTAAQITSGTLSADRLPVVPVIKGGTGAATASEARTNLGITPANIGAAPATHNHSASQINSGTLSADRLPIIPITKGGTGASTVEDVRTNLGISFLTAATTVYVSTSGNDTSGNGTSGAPFRTITKALSTIPKNMNGYGCTISLAGGTYAETALIADFFGGVITLTGTAGSTVSVQGLDIRNCSVLVTNITLSVGNVGIYVGSRAMLYCASGAITVTGASQALTLRYGAIVEITTTLTINNASDRAVQVQYASTVSIANLAGTNNSIGIYAYHSTVFVRNMTLVATTRTINENSIYNIGGAVG